MLYGFSMKGRLYVKYKVNGLENVVLFKEFLNMKKVSKVYGLKPHTIIFDEFLFDVKEYYTMKEGEKYENTNGKNTLVDSPKDGR